MALGTYIIRPNSDDSVPASWITYSGASPQYTKINESNSWDGFSDTTLVKHQQAGLSFVPAIQFGFPDTVVLGTDEFVSSITVKAWAKADPNDVRDFKLTLTFAAAGMPTPSAGATSMDWASYGPWAVSAAFIEQQAKWTPSSSPSQTHMNGIQLLISGSSSAPTDPGGSPTTELGIYRVWLEVVVSSSVYAYRMVI
jgi:hypothetical protein